MFRNPSVDVHQFAMVPRADVPRSRFRIQSAHKTCFDAGWIVPIYEDEVLPGDSFSLSMTGFCRLATPIFPFMDNLYLDTFWFFVPNRLLWTNWKRFMGEQDNPADSISYVVPTMASTAGGYAIGSIYDYFGLPTAGQVTAGQVVTHNTLHLRAYNLCVRDWFRDENLQNSPVINVDDGPDAVADYALVRRGKRKDYFTSALPWPQKGTAVSLPLGVSATVRTSSTNLVTGANANPLRMLDSTAGGTGNTTLGIYGGIGQVGRSTTASPAAADSVYPANLYADLSTATAATVNQLRQSFQIQKLLERDARGGTRYTELTRAHFGVVSPDSRLQRPELLSTSSTPIVINPVAQTSETSAVAPQGNLAGIGTGVARAGFTQSFTEHGVILGLASVRADLNYQQGLRKMWSRSTRYDFYFPVFAQLGEQAILTKEIWCKGDGVASDAQVFGYQERWGEMRYHPSKISSLMRSTAALTIDAWHLAQHFTAQPTLNATFIEEAPPIARVVAVGAGAAGQEFIFDSFFDVMAARPMPLYSVPGLIDHF